MKQGRFLTMAATTLALTLLAGCGSMGNILGGGDPNYPNGQSSPSSQSSRVQGTVNNVDTRNQRIDLNIYSVDGRSAQQSATIYYDSRTRLNYRGQSGNPSGLERGDQIDVQLLNNGNGQLMAETINVTQSVSDSSSSPNNNYPNNGYPNNGSPNNGYPTTAQSDLRGTVSNVDTRAQRIDITSAYGSNLRNSQGSGSTYSIYYDSRTRVYYQNQTHSPADLERGDEIDVRLSGNNRNGQQIADTINVVRNVRQ
ncbi:MAG: DUF5666 domain-containing protein [Acidobacteriota bacterium]